MDKRINASEKYSRKLLVNLRENSNSYKILECTHIFRKINIPGSYAFSTFLDISKPNEPLKF